MNIWVLFTFICKCFFLRILTSIAIIIIICFRTLLGLQVVPYFTILFDRYKYVRLYQVGVFFTL